MKRRIFLIIVTIACSWQVSPAQTTQERMLGEQTTGFSYQGSLKNAGAPANGNHDFEFRLWDAASGGAQVGSTVTLNGVAVTNGIFAVTLDFGNQYPDAFRFLEVRVRPTGGGAFTTLTPREQIKAVPYAVKSLNAEQLGGVAASQYVTTTGGGANFIQNTTTQQAASNFFISGIGTSAGTLQGNEVNANQYNIGGSRFMSVAQETTIVGRFAGGTNNTGIQNSFFGQASGAANTTGSRNAFFGDYAGRDNVTGNTNSYFGSFVGSTTTGSFNAFFGGHAIDQVQTTTGSSNSFFGAITGVSNRTGSNNTLVGAGADVGASNLTNATAIGYRAFVGTNNSLVLGSINGVNGATANANVGIGTTTPTERLHVVGNGRIDGLFGAMGNAEFGANLGVTGNGIFFGNVGIGTTAPGYKLHVVGQDVRVEGNNSTISPRFSLNFTGGGTDAKKWQNYASTDALVFSALNDAENAQNIWMQVNRGAGTAISSVEFRSSVVAINNLGAAGATALCRNASNEISTCSSSLKYKTNVSQFSQGMSFVNKLRPISYQWKDGGLKDVGFGAEDIAKIDPRFVTYNSAGEVEGVKYDRLSVAFVNAFKEQQEAISSQQSAISELQAVSEEQKNKIADQNSRITDQQKQIDDLKKIVCSLKPDAEICTEVRREKE